MWRQEQAARQGIWQAWHVAALMRQKKLPKLKTLLRHVARPEPQSPDQVKRNIMAWASAAGLRLHHTGTAGN